ncbi:MAG: LamG-like jellyroll fold domain-containing protein [Rudaea sp.]
MRGHRLRMGLAVPPALAASFSPARVAGLTLWLKSDAIGGLADGDPVASWPDMSGRGGRDLSQATAGKRPAFRTNVVNGKPAVRFDGVDDFLATANLFGSALFAADQADIFVALRQDSTKANQVLFSWDGTANRVTIGVDDGGQIKFDHPTNDVTGRISVAQPASWEDNWHVIECYRNGNADSAIYIDGASRVTGAQTTALNLTRSMPLVLGDYQADGGWQFKGDVLEVIIYSRSLTAIERANVTGYLKARAGVA